MTRSQRVRIREIMRLHIQLPALAELQQRSVILHSNVPPSFIDPEYSIIGLLYHLMLAMKSMGLLARLTLPVPGYRHSRLHIIADLGANPVKMLGSEVPVHRGLILPSLYEAHVVWIVYLLIERIADVSRLLPALDGQLPALPPAIFLYPACAL